MLYFLAAIIFSIVLVFSLLSISDAIQDFLAWYRNGAP
jgi:hypothetical protein